MQIYLTDLICLTYNKYKFKYLTYDKKNQLQKPVIIFNIQEVY